MYQVIPNQDFSGGLNELVSKFNLKDSETPDIQNFNLNKEGILSKRMGTFALNKKSDFDDGAYSANYIVGLFKFVDSNNIESFLAVVRNKDKREDQLWKYKSRTWSKVSSLAFSNSYTYSFLEFNDKLLISNGVDNLYTYDGTTLSVISSGSSDYSWTFNDETNFILHGTGIIVDTVNGYVTLDGTYTGSDPNVYVETKYSLKTVELLSMEYDSGEVSSGGNPRLGLQVSYDNGATWWYHTGVIWNEVYDAIPSTTVNPTILESGTFDNTISNLATLTYEKGINFRIRIFLFADTANYPYIKQIWGTHFPNSIHKCKYMVEFKNRVFYAGSTDYKNLVFISEPYDYETIDIFSWISVKSKSGDYITGLSTINNILIIFTKLKTFIYYGDSSDLSEWRLMEMPPPIGCIDYKSIQNCENEIIFLSDKGLYGFDGSTFRHLSIKLPTTEADIIKSKYFCSAYRDHIYYLNYYSYIYNNYYTLVYHYQFDIFTKYKGWKANVMYNDSLDRDFYFGRRDLPIVMKTDYRYYDMNYLSSEGYYVYDEFSNPYVYNGENYSGIKELISGSSLSSYESYVNYLLEFSNNHTPNISQTVEIEYDFDDGTYRYLLFKQGQPYTGNKTLKEKFDDSSLFDLSDANKIEITGGVLRLKAGYGYGGYGQGGYGQLTYSGNYQYAEYNVGTNFINEVKNLHIDHSSGSKTHIFATFSYDNGATWRFFDVSTGSWKSSNVPSVIIGLENPSLYMTEITNESDRNILNTNWSGFTVGSGQSGTSFHTFRFVLFLKSDYATDNVIINEISFLFSDYLADYKYQLHAPIECYWDSKFSNFNRLDLEKRYRLFFIQCSGATDELLIKYKLDDYMSWEQLNTYSITGTNLWGSSDFIWGTSKWENRGIKTGKFIFPSIKNRSKILQLQFYNNDTKELNIYGYANKMNYLHKGNLVPLAS